MQNDLPAIPNINYDFEADPNIFDDDIVQYDEPVPNNVQYYDNGNEYEDPQYMDEEDQSTIPPPPVKSLAYSSPHKQQIHELEAQHGRIKNIVSQMRNEMEQFSQTSSPRSFHSISPHSPTTNFNPRKIRPIIHKHNNLPNNLENKINTHNEENTTDDSESLQEAAPVRVPKSKKQLYTENNRQEEQTRKHIHDLEKLLNKTQDELVMAQTEIQDYETQCSSYKAELNSYKFTAKQKQINLQQLHRQIAILQRQNDSYYEDLNIAKETNKILESQLIQLQSEVSLYKSDYNKQFTSTLRSDLDKEKEQKLVAENKFLRMKMEEATKDIKRLMYEKEKLIDISNMLRSDIVQLNDKLSSQPQREEKESQPIIDHYEDRIAELEVLVRKLNLHNKVLKKELEESLRTNQHFKAPEDIQIKGQPTHFITKPKESHFQEKKPALPVSRSQKALEQKTKLLEQRNAISQTIQKKNNK